jgi:hypothetical protein
MSITTRRTIPLILISFCITVITLQYFLSIDVLTNVKNELVRWGTIGTAMAVIYGISVEVVRNIRLASRNRTTKDLINYSLYFLFMIYFIATGVLYGVGSQQFTNAYVRILAPSTFAIELVYGLMLVSAGYRTMRVHSFTSAALAISALLILLRNSPMMTTFFPFIAPMADWLKIPLTGGSRGALIGAGIGALMISLRAIALGEPGLVEAGD